MIVRSDELHNALDILLQHFEKEGQNCFQIDGDFYWNVPADELYDRYDQPVHLDVGQLSEDWARIEQIVRGEHEPVANGFVWLAAILRAVGHGLTT